MLNQPHSISHTAPQAPWKAEAAQDEAESFRVKPGAGCGRGCPDCTCAKTFAELIKAGR